MLRATEHAGREIFHNTLSRAENRYLAAKNEVSFIAYLHSAYAFRRCADMYARKSVAHMTLSMRRYGCLVTYIESVPVWKPRD